LCIFKGYQYALLLGWRVGQVKFYDGVEKGQVIFQESIGQLSIVLHALTTD
jgi:hypothetical protein